jgi:hypothetical protein
LALDQMRRSYIVTPPDELEILEEATAIVEGGWIFTCYLKERPGVSEENGLPGVPSFYVTADGGVVQHLVPYIPLGEQAELMYSNYRRGRPVTEGIRELMMRYLDKFRNGGTTSENR